MSSRLHVCWTTDVLCIPPNKTMHPREIGKHDNKLQPPPPPAYISDVYAERLHLAHQTVPLGTVLLTSGTYTGQTVSARRFECIREEEDTTARRRRRFGRPTLPKTCFVGQLFFSFHPINEENNHSSTLRRHTHKEGVGERDDVGHRA